MSKPIDWALPIETDNNEATPLVAQKRLNDQEMRWVNVEGGEEGWDGWYVSNDGQPQFTGVSGGSLVRNRITRNN